MPGEETPTYETTRTFQMVNSKRTLPDNTHQTEDPKRKSQLTYTNRTIPKTTNCADLGKYILIDFPSVDCPMTFRKTERFCFFMILRLPSDCCRPPCLPSMSLRIARQYSNIPCTCFFDENPFEVEKQNERRSRKACKLYVPNEPRQP